MQMYLPSPDYGMICSEGCKCFHIVRVTRYGMILSVLYKRSAQKTSDYSNILENLCAVQMYRNSNNMYYVDTNDHGTTGHLESILFHAHA